MASKIVGPATFAAVLKTLYEHMIGGCLLQAEGLRKTDQNKGGSAAGTAEAGRYRID